VSEVEPRIVAAWRQWLTAVASDPEAAIAAAQVYGALAPEGRDAWLDTLEEDAPKLGVPRVALYAPLLGVEEDPLRLDRIRQAIAEDAASVTRNTTALRGVAKDGARVAVLVAPLYAEFVQVLWCRYQTHSGFEVVRLDPIQRASAAPRAGDRAEGVVLEATPLSPVVEELALAILAQRRRGQEIPRSMVSFANLFDANFEAEPGG
jgi:hypothetical protein